LRSGRALYCKYRIRQEKRNLINVRVPREEVRNSNIRLGSQSFPRFFGVPALKAGGHSAGHVTRLLARGNLSDSPSQSAHPVHGARVIGGVERRGEGEGYRAESSGRRPGYARHRVCVTGRRRLVRGSCRVRKPSRGRPGDRVNFGNRRPPPASGLRRIVG